MALRSPLLANLFLHYTLDRWLTVNYPQVPFERFADDVIVHCRTERQAQGVKAAIAKRLQDCGLELHPEKTKIEAPYFRNATRMLLTNRSFEVYTESIS